MYNWLVLLNLAAAFYNVGTIWLTQVDWQLWKYVGRETFDKYHLAWWHSVWWSIFPLAGVSFVGICAQLFGVRQFLHGCSGSHSSYKYWRIVGQRFGGDEDRGS